MKAAANQVRIQERGAYLRSDARYLWAAQAVQRIFSMATLFLVARLLGVDQFGAYALLRTVIEMVALVTGAGSMDYVTREVAKEPEAAWKFLIRVTQVRWVYCVPVTGAALVLLKMFQFPAGLVGNAVLFSSILFFRAAGESALGALKGLGRFAVLPWAELLRGCLFLVLSPVLIFRGLGLKGAIVAEILAISAVMAFSLAALLRHAKARSRGRVSFRLVMRSMLVFNVYPFITTVYDRIDVVLLSKLAGNIATGIYSLPYRAFSSLQIIPYGMMGALLPGFSSSHVDAESQQRCARAMRFLYSISLLAVLAALGFARSMVLFVLGRDYAASAIVFKILVCAAVPAFMNHALNTLLLAAHKEKIFLWTATICTAFNISANLLLIPRFSFMAAAVITVFTEVLLLVQNCYLSKKYFGRLVLPEGGFKTTAGFAAALAGWFVLSHVLPDVWAGAVACGAFASLVVLVYRVSSLSPSARQQR